MHSRRPLLKMIVAGEDHTNAFAGIDSKAPSAVESLDAVRQGANVGAIAEDQPGVEGGGASESQQPAYASFEAAAAADSSSSSDSDAELPPVDESKDVAAAMYVEEADLPLAGAPPMEKLSDPSLVQKWLEQRRAYIQQLWDSKFFNFKEGQPQTPPLGNWTATGHLKRADMAVGRQRPDLMHSLPQDLVREMAQLKPLFSDKKIASSYKRMAATYVEGRDTDQGSGGPAQTPDLLRFLYSIDVAMSRTDNMTKKHPSVQDVTTIENQMRLGAQILPMISALLAKQPEPAAIKAAEAAKAAHQSWSESIQMPPGTGSKYGREQRTSRFEQHDQKPGDWVCPECNANNFARRTSCFKCDASRPAGMPARFAERRSSPDAAAQPGDWACAECGFSNFARRKTCFQCNAGRPAGTAPTSGMKPGDWECGDCGEVNFARRTECFGCGAPVSSAAKMEPSVGRGSMRQDRGSMRQERGSMDRSSRSSDRTPSPMEMRPGDWLCPECRAHNFATKTECFKCTFPRPASAGPPRTDARAGAGPGDRGMQPGDWSCPSCNSHNFAKRDQCFSCGQDRPAEAGRGFADRGPPRQPRMEGAGWWDDAGSASRGSGRPGRSGGGRSGGGRSGGGSQRSDRPRSIPDSSGGAPQGRDDFW
ncbi:hypothetical protein WJX84_011091 [Apatococcus fuscideae]|uniref:RanBP2-type domain-containing protein n=1 Tax=Apatococcus fuscideae TaxID=2026836 RepID=A0AAW1T9M4_9CHLO